MKRDNQQERFLTPEYLASFIDDRIVLESSSETTRQASAGKADDDIVRSRQ